MMPATRAGAQEAWSAEAARTELAGTLTRVDEGGSMADAFVELDELLDGAIAHAPLDRPAIFAEIDTPRRLLGQLRSLDDGTRADAWAVLRANPDLARAMAYLPVDGPDRPAQVYAVLLALARARGASVAGHPTLVAAICVVHDGPFPTGAMGELRPGADALRVYDHFTGHAGDLVFDPDRLPAPLLVHLVDFGAGEDDLRWAMSRYKGDRLVGKRYHDIVYDTRFYKQGADKRIDEHPYTLENIRRYGGVCTDQAYYAATIGKAIGVPTAIVSGRAGEVGHCWVGFLRAEGRGLRWDFEEGRYEDFEDVRGSARDPQTGGRVSDDEIALTADLAATSAEDRAAARALVDAVIRVERGYDPGAHGEGARPATDATRLELLRRAASLSPADAQVWQAAARLAARGAMDADELRHWADALHGHFGDRYPTFTISILRPMIASVKDTEEQSRLWDWAHRRYRRQQDLACEILIEHAEMWERAGDKARAYDGYVDAAYRYVNDSAVAIDALRRADRLLSNSRKDEHVLALYEEAWRRVRRPHMASTTFVRGTNWYKIGARNADLLEAAGRAGDAARIRGQIGADE